jgi:hypothetical protein
VTSESPGRSHALRRADMNRLLAALVVAALAIGIGFYFGLISKVLLSKLLQLPGPRGDDAANAPVLGSIAVAVIDLLSIAAATWLLFRRLQPHYTRRETKAAAATFALLSPVMIAAAFFVAGKLMFYLSFDLRLPGPVSLAVGGVSGIVLAVSLLGFGFCGTALWVTRRTMGGN